ncbi:MAG: heavy metal translocating P-type ATPase [Phycisphaerales bacterium]
MSRVDTNPAPRFRGEQSALEVRAILPEVPYALEASLTAGLLLLAAFVVGKAGMPEPAAALGWMSLGIGMVYGGREALESLLARRFDIDALMVVAAGLAAWIGQAAEGALLLFLFTLSGALEDRAMRRTMRAVEALHALMPTKAMVWRGEGAEGQRDGWTEGQGNERAGRWTEVAPAELAPGDRVLIRTGESIPTDARVLVGESTIDQATLTGESVPRVVAPEDEVYAGTLNVGNPIEARVVRPASESSLQRILNLVLEAQQQREPIQRLIDRLSQPYAVGVMVLSVGVMLVWWLVFGVELVAPEGRGGALYTAITLLIVASPCALVIATPTATLAAISRAARGGVLFKGGHAIERLARIGAVVIDKTGTLTYGRPRLNQVHPVAWSEGPDLLAVAAALEAGSTHPVARAVVEAAESRGIAPFRAEALTDLPGRGLTGVVHGREARLGTYEHAEPIVTVCFRARVRELLDRVRSRGQIGVVVAWADAAGVAEERKAATGGEPDAGGGQVAVLILSDTIRPGAAEMIARLHGLGVTPVRMLTGDNRVTAEYVARRLGIDQWDAELLPQDKVRIVGELKGSMPVRRRFLWKVRAGVGVVGDGVNDAPALAASDVSIAIGSIGSDAALESADIVLLADDLRVVPWAVRIAQSARAIVAFNLAFALAVIVGMGLVTLIGSRIGVVVPLSSAVIAHEGGTLLVVLNSLRLLVYGGPHQHGAPVSSVSAGADPSAAASWAAPA